MAAFNSFGSIVPPPSVSKRSNAFCKKLILELKNEIFYFLLFIYFNWKKNEITSFISKISSSVNPGLSYYFALKPDFPPFWAIYYFGGILEQRLKFFKNNI